MPVRAPASCVDAARVGYAARTVGVLAERSSLAARSWVRYPNSARHGTVMPATTNPVTQTPTSALRMSMPEAREHRVVEQHGCADGDHEREQRAQVAQLRDRIREEVDELQGRECEQRDDREVVHRPPPGGVRKALRLPHTSDSHRARCVTTRAFPAARMSPRGLRPRARRVGCGARSRRPAAAERCSSMRAT